MTGRLWGVLAAGLLLSTAGAQQTAAPPSPLPEKVLFNRDIRPILSENCLKCHGPDKKANTSALRLDTKEGAFASLEESRYALVPGKPEKSDLVRRITSKDPDERMPPPKSNKKLTPYQIALLKKWIEQGAEWQGHWAFIPPQRAPLPRVTNPAWPRNAIDRILLARLEKEGLSPSPEADRVTLLRRLSFDLTGLPPAVADVDAFLADEAGDAFEKQVERLLASPHYGERMAIFWLDLVRFANSRGYHSDNPRMVDPYRDYVIEAFNENMPFDRFTTEQLAGDLLPESTLLQRIATCYNRLNQTTEEGGAQAKEYEAKTAADRVRNASGVWLGATLGCAECHDHKFDPYTMRDFYSLAAFFADVKEQAIKDADRGVIVPSEDQAAQLKRFDERIARLKKTLETPTPELAAAQAQWEKTALAPFPWVTLVPESIQSAGNSTFFTEEDGSIFAAGPNPAKDTHTVTIKTSLQGITGFRLEAFADPTLPGSGPGRAANGNFILTRFHVKIGDHEVGLHKPVADFSQDQWPIAAALDAKKQSGWAVLPHTGKDHTAIFETKGETGKVEAMTLVFVLEYQSVHPQHILGRFRLSATTRTDPSKATALPEGIRAILKAPAETRTDAHKEELAATYRSIAPLLAPVRSELAETEKKKADYLKTIPTCLISMAENPRVVRIKPRGNWMDDSGEIVSPNTPQFLTPLTVGERRATRLDLARWLVSRENPLTARVFVNRLWKLFFGTGISKRLDDLGAQGEWPVHPELLDWMAVDFTESGWNVKRLVKLLVTSAAYRQTSTVTRELRERDPENRLLARQSRWRLDAEMVRDNALAVSQLLVRKVGGESARPYQPKGYWAFLNFPTREWQNDAGENAYRRGLYTWWQRTFPHPSLLAFDAPSREECCAERTRSNIPQQALALLNDPTYIEAARVFAELIARKGGTGVSDRLAWACRRALSRAPTPEEQKVLEGLYRKHRDEFIADKKAAQELVSVGQAPVAKDLEAAEIAAWTSVARTLLNLHETITRN